jgi:hypothetical protein
MALATGTMFIINAVCADYAYIADDWQVVKLGPTLTQLQTISADRGMIMELIGYRRLTNHDN